MQIGDAGGADQHLVQVGPLHVQRHAHQVQALVGSAVVDHLRGFYMGDRIGNDADQLCLATDVHGKPQG
ncbi:hypothetical protein D3C78_1606110 [compost metagenome]